MAKKNHEKAAPSQPIKNTHTGSSKSPSVSQEKKPLVIAKGASLSIALAVTLVVVALGAYYLVTRNSDTLFMAQSKSYFTTNGVFRSECMRQPGGLLTWTASFLTQFLYHPVIGSTFLIGLWVIAMWLSKFAFRVKMAWMALLSVPAICLLVSTIDTGYWIYYLKQEGYWFYGTVGYLAAMLLVFAHSFPKMRTDKIIAKLLIALTYPLFGWYTLLALLYCATYDLSRMQEEEKLLDKALQPVLAVILMAGIPYGCHYLYPEIKIEDAWTYGFPCFENDNLHSRIPEVPFFILAAAPLIFPFLPRKKELKGGMAWLTYLITIAIMAVSCIWVEKSDFQSYNYHAEMRMYRAADEQDWNKLLDEMSALPGDASRQMVLLKNIALLNTGEMGTKMFKYNNMGDNPKNGFDTLQVHMVQTAAPLIYYYHGKTNFASRWCIENSVEFGFDFDNLKMLARCALVNGEMDAAKKYLNILMTSMYYRDWAENLMPITEKPELIKEYHEFDKVRELRDHMGTVLDGDQGLCEMYLLNYFSNTMNKDDKLLQELTLNYAMVQKDIQLFWPRFFLYAQLHKDQDMPIHYQEAAYLYGHLEPETVNISNMPFDEKVKERYKGFQHLSQSLLQTGITPQEVGEAMKSTYGDTFFWFYFFCRDIHSY